MSPTDLPPACRCASRYGTLGIALLFLSGCTEIPDGAEAVTAFELDRYLGQWHEIARLDHSFERGLDCVTAHYSLRRDGGVRVINRGYRLDEGRWEEAEGRAYFVGDESVGRLRVSFFGPFYNGYNVLGLDEEYRHALVSGPDLDTLWILARSPEPDDAVYEALREQAAELGFPVGELIEVEQGGSCPAR